MPRGASPRAARLSWRRIFGINSRPLRMWISGVVPHAGAACAAASSTPSTAPSRAAPRAAPAVPAFDAKYLIQLRLRDIAECSDPIICRLAGTPPHRRRGRGERVRSSSTEAVENPVEEPVIRGSAIRSLRSVQRFAPSRCVADRAAPGTVPGPSPASVARGSVRRPTHPPGVRAVVRRRPPGRDIVPSVDRRTPTAAGGHQSEGSPR